MPVLNANALINNRVEAIRAYHDQCGVDRAELDVSGGVDSAVMLGLLAHALGPDRVTAVYQGVNSSPESLARAREVAAVFKVPLVEIDLTPFVEPLIGEMVRCLVRAGYDEDAIDELIGVDRTVLGSLRSCIRAPIGRGFNRMTGGGIRHGTGNECEDRWLRFYQKGGDGEVDTNPIDMLSKGEVFQVARTLGVPRSILTALPSPDLWGEGDQHNDEDELLSWLGVAFTYSRVDPDTGEYTRVGTIERVSRLLDECGANLFHGDDPERSCDYIAGTDTAAFRGSGLSSDQIRTLLRAARRAEKATRHKMNPICPSLGTRWSLVEARLLTNELPDVSGEGA